MLRSLEKDQVFEPLIKYISNGIQDLDSQFDTQKRKLQDRLLVLKSFKIELSSKERDYSEASARMQSFSIAEVIIGILLIQNGLWEKENKNTEKGIQVALRWLERPFTQMIKTHEQHRKSAKIIASDEEIQKEFKIIEAD